MPKRDENLPGSRPRRLNLESGVALFASAVLLLGALLWAAKGPTVEKTDFSVTYIGSRMVYLGLGRSLYDLAEQKKLKDSLLPNGSPLIFEHPPFEALLLSPLGALPYRAAYLIWGLVNVAIWLALPWLLRSYAPVPRDALAYFALWLLFAPLGVTLFQGQSSLVVLLLYSVAFICLNRGEDFRGGLALALALVKFQFVVPMVLIFVVRRKWVFLKGFLTMASGLAVLSLFAVGWRGILGYLHLLANVGVHPDNLSYGAAVDMATIQGFVHALLGTTFGGFLNFAVVAAISAFLIFWTASTWNRIEQHSEGGGNNRSSDDLMFAAAIVVSLVAGFHMFTHDLSPLMLAMLLVCSHLASSHHAALRVVLVGCMTVFWTPVIYFVLLSSHHSYLLFPVLLAFALAAARLAADRAPMIIRSVPLQIRPGACEV